MKQKRSNSNDTTTLNRQRGLRIKRQLSIKEDFIDYANELEKKYDAWKEISETKLEALKNITREFYEVDAVLKDIDNYIDSIPPAIYDSREFQAEFNRFAMGASQEWVGNYIDSIKEVQMKLENHLKRI